ncbi:DUF3800 domain-containing protein [Paenibacillus lemnae]|uniref:DUF3800 domain-containing protein n=1 Tax=Paenibacillus lemnae TaxID=1330551 RepID=A0A848MDG0_PAELE|nr:DUF3800 domain-containing protein [Paenibacillus lemnae]NMO97464.1 DUF3800 domain-containing protein [Paenibacillus lemnae]
MFFIDESGSIPKFLDQRFKNRYFVISFVHTNNPKHLKNTYKRAIGYLKGKHIDFFENLKDPKECKASEMLPYMKAYILEKLASNTDIKIGYMVVNNTEIQQRFRDKPGRSFNYLVKIIMENFSLTKEDIINLELNIDNRNTALEGLTELEGYLYNELVLNKGTVDSVKVNYLESCDHYNIQVADLIANVIYQKYRYHGMPFPNYSDINYDIDKVHPYTPEYLHQIVKRHIVVPYKYPPSRNPAYKQVSAAVQK